MDDKLKPNKKTALRKGDPLVVELIHRVRIKVAGSEGMPMGQDDFLNLHEDIANICKTNIDDRTLKEYLGHYQSRTDGCNLNILNAFAVYIGFKNFYDFKKEKENKPKPDDDGIPSSKLQEVPEAGSNNYIEKKERKIFLYITVTVIILGMLLFLLLNQKSIENPQKQAGKTENQDKTAQESIQLEKGKSEKLNNIIEEKTGKINLADAENMAVTKEIAGYLNNLNSKFDIAILIIDNDKHPEKELSSRIASFYRKQDYSVTNSLFTASFIQSQYLHGLQNANSKVITMLKLDSLINTVILGEVVYTFRDGTLEAGTIICTARISMNIVSVIQKSLVNSFSFSVNGNGVSEVQAKEQAFTKLFDKFKTEYSSL